MIWFSEFHNFIDVVVIQLYIYICSNCRNDFNENSQVVKELLKRRKEVEW